MGGCERKIRVKQGQRKTHTRRERGGGGGEREEGLLVVGAD